MNPFLNCYHVNASEDLRLRTSHETDGKAVTRKRGFFQAIVAFVVVDYNKFQIQRKHLNFYTFHLKIQLKRYFLMPLSQVELSFKSDEENKK